MSTEVLVKKDLILGGLTCAHCAEEIGKGVRKIDGIVDSNMNFVNKKLTVLFDYAYNEEEVIKAIIKKIDSIEPGLDIQVVEKRNRRAATNKPNSNNKREMILGGLTCAHCAEEIGNAISKMEGVKNSYLNFVNKKLLVELHPNKDEENLIKDIIAKIDSIEPGLDIQVVDKSAKKAKAVSNKREMILGGLTCAHCAEVIGTEVAKMEGIKNSHLNFVNKKLSLEFTEDVNQESLIKEIIAKIDSIEPGLDIQVKDDKKHSIDLNSFEGSTQKQQSVEKVKENKKKAKLSLNDEKAKLFKIIIGALVFIFAFYQEATGHENQYSLFIFLASYVIVGGDVLYKAFRNITRGRVFDENFLITVATTGAILTGEASEAVGVMLFYKIG